MMIIFLALVGFCFVLLSAELIASSSGRRFDLIASAVLFGLGMASLIAAATTLASLVVT